MCECSCHENKNAMNEGRVDQSQDNLRTTLSKVMLHYDHRVQMQCALHSLFSTAAEQALVIITRAIPITHPFHQTEPLSPPPPSSLCTHTLLTPNKGCKAQKQHTPLCSFAFSNLLYTKAHINAHTNDFNYTLPCYLDLGSLCNVEHNSPDIACAGPCCRRSRLLRVLAWCVVSSPSARTNKKDKSMLATMCTSSDEVHKEKGVNLWILRFME
jgi:hypothetical protein